jgi:branched-chain amino acid transport system permease protein
MVGAFAGLYLSRILKPLLAKVPEGLASVSLFGASMSPETAAFVHELLGAVIVMAAAMVVCALLGVIIEKLAYKPLRARPRLTVLITAIGVSLFLEYAAQLRFGAAPQGVPPLITTTLIGDPNKLSVTNTQVLILVITILLLIGLRFIVMNTRMGLAMRALSLNPTAAALMGVNINAVVSFTFALGSALAAAAGIFYAMLYPAIDPFMGVLPGVKAFVAAVLGGIGNIPGAALGGLLIGVVETLVVGYSSVIGIPPGYRDAVAFVILILILLFRPSGLLGKVEREKV